MNTIDHASALRDAEQELSQAAGELTAARAAYQQAPSGKAGAELLKLEDRVRLAALARDGARERFEATEQARVEADRAVTLDEFARAVEQLSADSFLASVQGEFEELIALERKCSELRAAVGERARLFSDARASFVARAQELGAKEPPAVRYLDAFSAEVERANGTPDELIHFMLSGLEHGTTAKLDAFLAGTDGASEFERISPAPWDRYTKARIELVGRLTRAEMHLEALCRSATPGTGERVAQLNVESAAIKRRFVLLKPPEPPVIADVPEVERPWRRRFAKTQAAAE